MTNIVYNKALQRIISGAFGLTTGDIKIALLSDSYSPNKDHDLFSQVSQYEITGVGYLAGGLPVIGKSVIEDDSNDIAVFKASAVEWPDSTFIARYAVLYEAVTGYLISCFDFGINRSTLNGVFRIDWNPDGIISFG